MREEELNQQRPAGARLTIKYPSGTGRKARRRTVCIMYGIPPVSAAEVDVLETSFGPRLGLVPIDYSALQPETIISSLGGRPGFSRQKAVTRPRLVVVNEEYAAESTSEHK